MDLESIVEQLKEKIYKLDARLEMLERKCDNNKKDINILKEGGNF